MLPSTVASPAVRRSCTSPGCEGATRVKLPCPSTSFSWVPGTRRSASLWLGPNSSVGAPAICSRAPRVAPLCSMVTITGAFSGAPRRSSTRTFTSTGVTPSAGPPAPITSTRICPTWALAAVLPVSRAAGAAPGVTASITGR